MRTNLGRCFFFLILSCSFGLLVHAQTSLSVRVLRNNDILQMVADNVRSGDIIQRIQTSPCNFDIFPPVIRDLRRRGVPETVLLAMLNAPSGPPAIKSDNANIPALTTPIQISIGTVIEVESAQAVSSGKVSAGSMITFFVTKRIFVKNILVIERGAIARAQVTRVKKASTFGRAGMLAWEMEYVVGVDGSHIPIRVAGEQRGANRSGVMAGGAAATAALIFPYSSPVALIWGLKKGDEAVLRGSKLFLATVKTETEIAGIQPRPGGVVYHDRETVKASAAPPTSTNFPRGSVRTGGFRPH